jgi:cell division protein FtsB
VRELSIEIIGTKADVRRRGGIIPFWVIIGMIMLGMGAVCVTVALRTQLEIRNASTEFVRIQNDVDLLKRGNTTLQSEIRRLSTDPKAIESAARSQLNMARANEIIIPVE